MVLIREQPFQPAVCLAAETNGCTPGGGHFTGLRSGDFPRAALEPDAWFFMHFSSVATLLTICVRLNFLGQCHLDSPSLSK